MNLLKRIEEKIKRTCLNANSEFRRRLRTHKAMRGWLSPEETAEYRKKIKIYDVFTFFNELDLLEMRLGVLDPHVDYFVIVEATETFSGTSKPLHFQENKGRFKKWESKIIHYPVKDVPKNEEDLRRRLKDENLTHLEKQIINDTLTSDNIDRKFLHWLKEFYIKESAKKALTSLHDDDFCYVSDLDEFWNPNLRIDYSKDDIFKMRQVGYSYYLNNRSNESDLTGWTGTVATKYKNIKNSCLNHLRTRRKMDSKYVFLRNGGWHFSNQGGVEGAKKKIVESNNPDFYSPEVIANIEKRVMNNQDRFGRKIKYWKDERGLPEYLLKNKEKYKNYFI